MLPTKNELRKTYEEAQKRNAERWWTEFEPKLKEALNTQAEGRHTSLTISLHHDLSKNNYEFIKSPSLVAKLKKEVEKAGLDFSESDSYDVNPSITISW